MMNRSPRVQPLAQLQDDIQQGHSVQNLMDLAAQVNPAAPARLRGVPMSGGAGLASEADGMGPKASVADESNLTGGAPGETETSDRPTFTGQEVAQRKEAAAEVKGLTHLVKKEGKSIHAATDEHEVEEPDQVVVETNDRIRSRRGPNQEEFDEYDEVSPGLYRWYGVRKAPRLDQPVDWYIREDAFEFKEEDEKPRVSTDLERVPGRRTRQSHHLVRFEVWHNTDQSIDRTGHMMMYEVRSKIFREYAQRREGGTVKGKLEPLKDAERIEGVKKKFESLNIEGFDKAPEPYYLAVFEMNEEQAHGRRRDETRKDKEKRDVPRFNIVSWVDVMLTVDESTQLDQQREFREGEGFYYFVKEVQTDYAGATRCLSWLEDAAKIQKITELITGHAVDVLNDYISKAGIKKYHTGQHEPFA
jgi:hypothetical protein